MTILSYHLKVVYLKWIILDIREYYIVRIAIVINGYFTAIDYHASPYKEKVRGQLFREGNQLFESYEKALEYAKEQGCNVEGYKENH